MFPAATIDTVDTSKLVVGTRRHEQRICIYSERLEDSINIRDEILKNFQRDHQALINAGNRLEKAFEALLPGLPHIAMQDYTLLDANHVWKQALKEFQHEQEIQTSPVGESD